MVGAGGWGDFLAAEKPSFFPKNSNGCSVFPNNRFFQQQEGLQMAGGLTRNAGDAIPKNRSRQQN